MGGFRKPSGILPKEEGMVVSHPCAAFGFSSFVFFYRKLRLFRLKVLYLHLDMYRMRRLLVWFRRVRHSRGFGIQSPWAYHFVRYVVDERYPYYAYAELGGSIAADKQTRKLCRLYFRIANYRQPRMVIDFGPSTPAYGLYIKAGCRKAEVVEVAADQDDDAFRRLFDERLSMVDMVRMSLAGNSRGFLEQVMARADKDTILVVEGIHRDRASRRQWKKLHDDASVGVTFDLYHCGVVFFDRKRYRKQYKMNF